MTTSRAIADHGITEGVIWKQILKFFFPILLGTLFQTLYNTADAIIVGKLLGKEALAAVGGGTATAINLVIGFFTGVASGATVIISHYYGARNEDLVHKSIHNAWAIAIWGGLIISVVGYFTSDPLLIVTKTPEDIFPLASQYMHIYFAGSIIVVMYNIGAGIFRAFGDSKRPLYFLIVGCLSNIALDFLFVGAFRMGVAGAAYATVLAQLISLVMVMVSLKRRDDACKLVFRDIKFNRIMLKKTLVIGLPA
ncbi:MAG TPA: MATE family efflux transporter, partial [Sphaerochaeta sp.]|nr:MATE family efflux transporter [Sphaerochaeta sp.]